MAPGGGVGGWGTPAAIFEGTWKEGKQKAGVGRVSEALPPPPPGGVGWCFCELPHRPARPAREPHPPLARMMGGGDPRGPLKVSQARGGAQGRRSWASAQGKLQPTGEVSGVGC